ncbi:MAG: bifunctional phosphoribosylaminoimidazolecarboxamide formyltransferase/IMP cyclohydrolase [Planctomycetes bacterium]|nr:bifunctional phosphoribosylaminoimidazolecarboxamide formyltransferase/IMP cyclohydrolase [Planctomycetota bacterium]
MTLRRALLSVSDKRGIVEFAKALAELDVELVSTGGTARALAEAGLAVRDVSSLTGFPEMMDGRVKTLHPKVHGGILARRDLETHRNAMAEHDIGPIDIVCVNLYPFEATIANPDVTWDEAIEQIDIGGPSMVRSAAKNHRDVLVVVDPDDYPRLIDMLRQDDEVGVEVRRELALKAFTLTARYDTAIATYLREQMGLGDLPETFLAAAHPGQVLRYGENPHQRASFFRDGSARGAALARAEVLGGKELSFNNLLDLDGALGLVNEFEEPTVCVIKHSNPCGCASADTIVQALEHAWEGDPVSAFGSILAFNRSFDLACARFLTDGGRFVECILATDYSQDALTHIAEKAKWGKNVRLLKLPTIGPTFRDRSECDVKRITGGWLVQDRDLAPMDGGAWQVATKNTPADDERRSAEFAWRVVKHVKSNAIVLVRGTQLVGVGAGQMSRVDSVEIACRKAGDKARGATLASDAFFPFPDGVEKAAEAGVRRVVQPGGSRRDTEVIEAADRLGLTMWLTGRRHFRH